MIVSRWATRQANQDPNITAEQLTETANRLLHRQFITRGDAGGANHFDRIVGNLDYFKDLFASFGFRFIFNDGWGYAGYVSPVAFNNTRVPTQETIVLLCLRLLYNEGAEKGYFVDSTAQILVEEEEIQTVLFLHGIANPQARRTARDTHDVQTPRVDNLRSEPLAPGLGRHHDTANDQRGGR